MASLKLVYGVEGTNAPVCSLLTLGNGAVRILLDCGWDSSYDEAVVAPLERVIAEGVDLVLLSSSSLLHCGALPIAVGRYGLRAPVYASYPTIKMGLMESYAMLLAAKEQRKPFTAFDLDMVDRAFSAYEGDDVAGSVAPAMQPLR